MNKIYTLALLMASFFTLKSQTPSASFATWKDNKKAAYSIIHDDYSNYVPGIVKHADPIATARGVKLCFGAITNFCDSAEWANARNMISHGHECVNHSHNHRCGGVAGQCSGLTTYGTADFDTELRLSTDIIQTNTAVRPRFFVHPYDAPSPAVIDFLKSLGYLGARSGNQLQVNANTLTDFMNINYFVYDGTASALAGLNPAVDQAITAGGWAVREFHGIEDGSWANMTIANYTSHLDYVKTKMDDGSLWSATTTEAITYKMQRDAFQPVVAYDAATNTITVSFTSLKVIDPSVLRTPVTVNVNLNGIVGAFDATQNNAAVVSSVKNGIVSFNVYPSNGTVTLKCNNCNGQPPVVIKPGCLKASYFANISLTGTPSKVQAETKIDNNWAANAPFAGFPADNFSVRWEGFVNVPVTGSYTFTMTGDDGIRLWVNNQLIIDKWIDQSATTYNIAVAMTQGDSVPIKMEYYEKGGSAVAKLAWTVPTLSSQIIAFDACPIAPQTALEFDASKCYRITARHSNKVMEITNNDTKDGNKIQQNALKGGLNQVWRIKNFDGTHFQVSNGFSGKMMTVATSSTADGAVIYQFQNQNGNNQKWKFEKNAAGYYALIAKHSNKALDIKSASTANKADAIQWTKSGSTNQQFAVAEIGCPANVSALANNYAVSFNGRQQDGKGVLDWAVQSEDLTDYYQVEKVDEKGDYKTLTVVNSTSQSEVRTFSYTDETLVDGDNFYRLKTIANDGSTQVSDLVNIRYAKLDSYGIFPNPATDDFTIDLTDAIGKNVDIAIVTAFGKVIKEVKIEEVSSKSHQMNLDDVEAGQYFINIKVAGKRSITKKLMIVK
jgi:peptidoglycan/xylan/chitin deacetylase (PgdA/CDA1 family)